MDIVGASERRTAERRECRTAQMPDGADAERRECRTAREARRRANGGSLFARSVALRAVWHSRCLAFALSGIRAVWHLRRSAFARFGICAVRHLRRLAFAPLIGVRLFSFDYRQ